MIIIIVAAILGCICQYFALIEVLETPDWFLAILLHAIASIFFAIVSYVFIPKKYKTTPYSSLLLMFLLLFTLPVLGIIGVVVALTFALCKPLKNDEIEIEEHKIPELPFEARAISANPTYSIGGLKAILKHANGPNKRLSAVMAARHMSDSQAIPILKLALKDLEDDIRLLAYSTLDGKETKLNEKISLYQQEIAVTTKQPKLSHLQKQLAELYWELSYLGLAQGALRKYVLEKAEALALQSIEHVKTPATFIFLGRISLALDKYEIAHEYLLKATEFGMARRHVLPYKAEVAFCMNKFDDCKRYLKELPEQPKGSELRHLQEYWHE
ncbi:protein PelE [Pseudoalteromonas distincta]|uniref:protein PelE n=1 Tax=Pseudoalteromonas distincta TaxID=77608 RepID=UPI00118F8B61|nr:protein PelE [Pseudoalteromonas elyakovii]TVU74548.1 protein PelE [Pseudoalteromonas elyakovii]|tara:strand:- start:299 stop:1282 length:984 start_codon:yes stop_codon:yes gene_type:complete